jgi:arylsulfatase A-like enzyme
MGSRISSASPRSRGLFVDIIAEMDYRVGQILDAVKELASTTTFSAATTRAAE